MSDRPPVTVGSGPETIRTLTAFIGAGGLPETYVSGGRVVHVERVSGSAPEAGAGDEDSPLPVAVSTLGPSSLAELLARHTYTHHVRSRKGKDGPEFYEEEVTPPNTTLAAVLAPRTWPGLRPLYGVIGAPVLRRDGTLLQDPGYDVASGYYLASKVALERVPDRPTAEQVEAAKRFVLERFMPDFPWVGDADRANYLGLLVTPILRPFTRCLAPFALVTSTTPGSGKTILTAGVGLLYGQRVLTWTGSDEELRKAVTTMVAEPVGCVVFDNLAEGTVVDSPVLARLITERTWADRRLGGNVAASIGNDKVWMANGNNVGVGGDMASRTVLVQLDPDTPEPESRSGFAIPDLEQWIVSPANQRVLLWHLLVLVVDWVNAGATRAGGLTMRQFSPWAQAVGGFLEHHEVKDFLGNAQVVRALDDDAAVFGAFYASWYKQYPPRWNPATQTNEYRMFSAAELRTMAEPQFMGLDRPPIDPWEGTFPTDGRGKLRTTKSLGKVLAGQVGRWRDTYVLRSSRDEGRNVRLYWVEHREPAGGSA